MSRYVDLDGLTWDGTPITSKIQEVKTRIGYMQGITTGWLWGDNVPYIDMEAHDAKVRADAIDEFRAECESASYIPIGYGHYVTDMRSIRKIAEQLKEKKNE